MSMSTILVGVIVIAFIILMRYVFTTEKDIGKIVEHALSSQSSFLFEVCMALSAAATIFIATDIVHDNAKFEVRSEYRAMLHWALTLSSIIASMRFGKEVMDVFNTPNFRQIFQAILVLVLAFVGPIANIDVISSTMGYEKVISSIFTLSLFETIYYTDGTESSMWSSLDPLLKGVIWCEVIHIITAVVVAVFAYEKVANKKEVKKDNDKKNDDKKKDEGKKDSDNKKPEKVAWVMPGIQKLVDDLSAELKQKDQKYNSVYLLSLINTAAQKQKNENETEEEVVKKIKKKFLDLHEYLHYNNEGLRMAKSITDETERTKEFEKHGNNKQKTIANILQLVTELK